MVLRLQSNGRKSRKLLYNKMAKPPWAWFRYIFAKKTLQLQQGMSNAQRLDQGSS